MQTHPFFPLQYVSAETLRALDPYIEEASKLTSIGQVRQELEMLGNAVRSHLQHADEETLPSSSAEEDWLA